MKLRAAMRALLTACMVLSWGLFLGLRPAHGQDGYVYPNPYNPDFGWLADEELAGIRDVACPFQLTVGFLGSPYYPKDFNLFATAWQNDRPFQGDALSDYSAYPDPDPLNLSGTNRWYNAGIRVKCFQYVYRDRVTGRTRFSAIIYDSLDAFERGDVRPADQACGGGGGGGGDYEQPIYGDAYNPYSPESLRPSGGCSGGGGSNGGGGSGEGSSGEGFGPGWEGGGGGGGVCGGSSALHYEAVCIDVLNEETGEWEEVWCGVAAICH